MKPSSFEKFLTALIAAFLLLTCFPSVCEAAPVMFALDRLPSGELVVVENTIDLFGDYLDQNVKSQNNDWVIAPGTAGSSSFIVENNTNRGMDYQLKITAPDAPQLPLKMRIQEADDTWLLGSNEQFVAIGETLVTTAAAALEKREEHTYTIEWCWSFEENDAKDTDLGNAAAAESLIYRLKFQLIAEASGDDGDDDQNVGNSTGNKADSSTAGGKLPNTGERAEPLIFKLAGLLLIGLVGLKEWRRHCP